MIAIIAFLVWIFLGILVLSFFMGASRLEDLQRRDAVRARVRRAQTILDSDYSI